MAPLLGRPYVLSIFVLIVIGFFVFGNSPSHNFWSSLSRYHKLGKHASTTPAKLHFVIPATSSNKYLCQLLLSGIILGYPTPILINWGSKEDQDDYVQHLAKVQGILNYLNALSPKQDNELFLMVDGYDVWFQLPPEILIQRYHSLVASSETRHHKNFPSTPLPNTVIFGQDKICWPGGPTRAACWAVPDSTIPPQAFGPDTDHAIAEHNRPRWLNSGTIMGPIRDVRAVFAATWDKILENHVENSDQFYFANVFAEQSYARGPTDTQEWPVQDQTQIAEEGVEPLEVPDIPARKNVEYGIGIDYDSSLFQTVAYYDDYIAWIKYTQPSDYMCLRSQEINPYHHFVLPDDLLGLSPATAMGIDLHDSTGILNATHLDSWGTVPLGTNTITKQVFPLIHFTGKKGYREMWWRRNWFYGVAEEVLRVKRAEDRYVGGALTTDFMRLEWEGLCRVHERFLFGQSGK